MSMCINLLFESCHPDDGVPLV